MPSGPLRLGYSFQHCIFIPTSLIAVGIQFLGGYASDYMRLKYLLLVFALGMALSIVGLSLLGGAPISYWMIIAGNGVVWGLYTVLIGVTWTVIGSALGPYMFSLSVDLTGSYDLVAWICFVISILVIGLSFKADNPGHKESRA